jgi:WhiB family redox-sensing transcriptional regulator
VGTVDDPLEAFFGWLRPAWHADAACREYPEISFVPGNGEPIQPAKKICAGCLVRRECLQAGIDGDEHGVWGGISQRDRRALRRRADAA